MPCRDNPSPQETEAARHAGEQRQLLERARFDKLTRMLCETMTLAEENGSIGSLSNEVQDWWFQHQEADRKRKEKEFASLETVMKEFKAAHKVYADGGYGIAGLQGYNDAALKLQQAIIASDI